MSSTRAQIPISSAAAQRLGRGFVLAVATLVLCPACTLAPPWGSAPWTSIPAPSPTQPAPGDIRGRVLPGLGMDDLDLASPMIVYVSNEDAAPPAAAPSVVAEIRREGNSLSPALIAVSVNQGVEFRFADEIHHRIFSYSEPGAFDLGVVGHGESRVVVFREPGVVRLYCSLHPSESAVIFVAPSPHFTTVPATGEVVLSGLPPGQYQLHTWSDALPSASLDVTVQPGKSASVAIPIPGWEGSD